MDVVECPVCGDTVDQSLMEESLRGRVVPWHGSGRWRRCDASGLSCEEAFAVAVIREQGGERLRLAAHP